MKPRLPTAGDAFCWALVLTLLAGMLVPIGAGLLERSRETHWLNTRTWTRHNSECRYFERTAEGRRCKAEEGEPCGLCGG